MRDVWALAEVRFSRKEVLDGIARIASLLRGDAAPEAREALREIGELLGTAEPPATGDSK
jgi:hypothetical protein